MSIFPNIRITEGIPEVIPRRVSDNIQEVYNFLSDALCEVVDFGSQIFIWDINPPDKGETNIAPTMLFRYLLDLVDATSALVKQGSADPSKLLIRTLFEVLLQLEYLFEKDFHNRSMAYLFTDIINEIKQYKAIDPLSPEGRTAKELFEREGISKFKHANDLQRLRTTIEKKEKMLASELFKEVFEEHQNLKMKKIKEIKWYGYFNGPINIRALASHLKMESIYFLLYKRWSGSVHASDIRRGKIVQHGEDSVSILQLRHSKDLQLIASYCISFSIMAFNSFIEKRIPEKLPELKKWYAGQRPNFNIIHLDKLLIEMED